MADDDLAGVARIDGDLEPAFAGRAVVAHGLSGHQQLPGDAEESRGIEFAFDLAQGLVDQVTTTIHVHGVGRLVERHQVRNLGHGHRVELRRAPASDQALPPRPDRWWRFARQPLPHIVREARVQALGLGQGLRQGCIGYRLEQIVHRGALSAPMSVEAVGRFKPAVSALGIQISGFGCWGWPAEERCRHDGRQVPHALRFTS